MPTKCKLKQVSSSSASGSAWMGSCYSCKSGGGKHTYTTVAMATPEETSNLKRGTPYTRASSTGFGFKRRTPTSLKSLSQERTSELVQNYENKLATLNSNSPRSSASRSSNKVGNNITNKHNVTNRTYHSNIPRPGTKSSGYCSSTVSSSTEDLNATNSSASTPDSNSNIILNTQELTKMVPNGLGVPSDTSVLINQGAPKKRIHDKNPDQAAMATVGRQQKGHKEGSPQTLAKGNNNQFEGGNGKSIRKIPSKMSTTFSGLPRLQKNSAKSEKNSLAKKGSETRTKSCPSVKNFDSYAHPNSKENKSEDYEAMQTSSDTLPDDDAIIFEFDSGVGKSFSEKTSKGEGDNETLADVSELASDTQSIGRGSKERSPEKYIIPTSEFGKQKSKSEEKGVSSAKTTSELTSKINLQIGDAPRPRGLMLPQKYRTADTSSVLKQNKTKVQELSEDLCKRKKDVKGKVEIIKASQIDYNKQIEDLKFADEDDDSIEINEITNMMEKLQVKKDQLCLANKKKGNAKIPEITNHHLEMSRNVAPNSLDESLDTTLTNSIESATLISEMEKSSIMTSSVESTSQQEPSQDTGPFSPPSERETFLIDDEIADQPELLACQPQEFQQLLQTQDSYMRSQDILLEDNCSPGNLGRLRSCSVDTLSPCSSLASDDLMLDFDRADESLLDGSNYRIFGDKFEDQILDSVGDYRDSPARHARMGKSIESTSPDTFEILDEWSRLLEYHGSPSGASFIHRARALSSPDAPTGSEARVLFRPPKQMTVAEGDDEGVKIDRSSYCSLVQDITNLKTMLLKLKRVLHEAETLNPFETQSFKNGLFHSLAHIDVPHGFDVGEETESTDKQPAVDDIVQENVDLRRQVVFLQQQIEDKDQTIKLLQQQMLKYSIESSLQSAEKNSSNAATQTDKPRLSLTSMAQSSSPEESICGTTVSSNARQATVGSSDQCVKQRKAEVSASNCSNASTGAASYISCSSSTSSSSNSSSHSAVPVPRERSVSAVELGTSLKKVPSRVNTTTTQACALPSSPKQAQSVDSIDDQDNESHSVSKPRSLSFVRTSSFRVSALPRPKMGTGLAKK